MNKESCIVCGSHENLKRGWTNATYCSEAHERSGVSRVFGSMPGGPLPSPGWVPLNVGIEIAQRWEEDDG